VAAGLILGLAGGFWLGSRNAPAVPAAPTQVSTPGGGAPAPASAVPTPSVSAKPVAQQADTAPAGPPAAAAPAPATPIPAPSSPAASPGPGRAAEGTVRGSIQVSASQQANVYLDGERKGMTPRSLKGVPLGSHSIRVTRPGYEAQEQTVVLTAQEPSASLSFALGRAAAPTPAGAARAPAPKSVLIVVVESTPTGARIRIDGRELAPTPLTVRQLRPGTHTLELRLPGYKVWSQKLTVAAGDNRRIMATLERDNTR
jgi:hypothetical protein